MKTLTQYINEDRTSKYEIKYSVHNITKKDAENAANLVNDMIKNKVPCIGWEWVDVTFRLSHVLQIWREKHPEDYNDEYTWIHGKASYNWHKYEDPD